MHLDSIDEKLLNLAQVEFPLTREPYTDLGLCLGIDEYEVIRRIEQLRARGLVRQISPVFDVRSLGYKTTLVVMRVAETELEKAAQLIIEHPGVSHGYKRDHHFNLWFTLAIPAKATVETELERFASPIEAEAVFALPATKLFKLRACFTVGNQTEESAVARMDGVRPRKVELSLVDRVVINELQQDLPLVSAPFTTMAVKLGMDEEKFLAQCQSLLQRGIIRRFGAMINHRRVGFKANAMTCWVAPPEKVEAAGQKLASLREVTHCYERKTNPLWQYNLFAMIHGHSRKECLEVANKVSTETGLMNRVLLFSTKEFKKVRVKYLV